MTNLKALEERLCYLDAGGLPPIRIRKKPGPRPNEARGRPGEEVAYVAAKRAGKTLQQIAAGVNPPVTREWIRVILKRYEERTGDRLPRQRASRGVRGPRPDRWKPRMLWKCASCGKEEYLTEREREWQHRTDKCKKCLVRLTDEAITKAIGLRLAGTRWVDVCAELGEPRNRHQAIAIRIWTRMLNEGELTMPNIVAIFGRYGWQWLNNRTPPGKRIDPYA
jgi:hypothetical protein